MGAGRRLIGATADTSGTFAGAGGESIVWRTWLPAQAQTPRSVVVVAHGFGEHMGRYEALADRLAADGHAVVALDHHGHGRSGGTRALVSFDRAVADLDTLVDRVVEAGALAPALRGRPLFLLGHSMGGALALRYAMVHSDRLAGLVLSGPLAEVEGHGAVKAVGRLLGRIAPRLSVAKLAASDVSRDPAVVAAYEADPLVHHGGVPAGTAAEFLRHVETLPDDVGSIRVPTLLVWGTADKLCAPSGAEMIAARIGSSDLTARPFEGLYHEVFNEPEREQVLAVLTEWLDAHTGGS